MEIEQHQLSEALKAERASNKAYLQEHARSQELRVEVSVLRAKGQGKGGNGHHHDHKHGNGTGDSLGPTGKLHEELEEAVTLLEMAAENMVDMEVSLERHRKLGNIPEEAYQDLSGCLQTALEGMMA